MLTVVCAVACAVIFIVLVGMVYRIVYGASPAISKFGLGFFIHAKWDPALSIFGAWAMIYGTLLTSVLSLIGATVLGVAIGLLLALMLPRRVAGVLGPLVELLAAIPSIVIGLLGIIAIAPFVVHHIEPWLHRVFGFIPLFGTPGTVGNSVFTASLVLTFMVLPIIAALTRDIFLTVPQELMDGAEALGATRFEVIRGVVLPTSASGIISARVLGFGRALGEAIAVSQVIGGGFAVHANLFTQGNSLGANIADEFPSASTSLYFSALYYLAVILLLFGLASNLLSQRIAAGLTLRRQA